MSKLEIEVKKALQEHLPFYEEEKIDQKVIFDREGCKHTSAG